MINLDGGDLGVTPGFEYFSKFPIDGAIGLCRFVSTDRTELALFVAQAKLVGAKFLCLGEDFVFPLFGASGGVTGRSIAYMYIYDGAI